MKIGDLIEDLTCGEVALVLREPRISRDCLPGGEAHPHEEYYFVKVLSCRGIEDWDTDDSRVLIESR